MFISRGKNSCIMIKALLILLIISVGIIYYILELILLMNLFLEFHLI